ncbi:MAG: hypothetical protein H7A45_16505 [Verrucomicrobiales bacterium]|nr:hypothetical protein [Verrucomicrobiales bacterium]MCP5527899.1 hypothetical protein [Verrucomicrobiales bacterium]
MDLNTHRKWQGGWHSVEGEDYYFCAGGDLYSAARAHLPGFWTGAEGLAHPIKDSQGKRYIFKSFTIQCEERAQRMQWLCRQRLCECGDLWLLRGAPYRHLPDPWHAQICPFVEGKTWDSWKADDVRLTSDQRLTLSFSLAEAITLLEAGLAMCHSDLSPGNFIIDLSSTDGLPRVSLIDFDAFYHPKVPVLPVGRGQTLGTPGYQAPEFAGANKIIQTDRFALAVLIHEILALGEDPDLGEPDHRFFEQEDLNRRRARPTPRFRQYWGDDVYRLVVRALTAPGTDDRPAPREWTEAFLALGAPDAKPGLLMTAERNGSRLRFELKSAEVDLARALRDPDVCLQLERDDGAYRVRHNGSRRALGKPAILKDPKTGKHIPLRDIAQVVIPGAMIVVAGWELSFHAKQD